MKRKVLNLAAGLLLIGSVGYIFGQFGSLECDVISISQFVVRCGIGLVVLAFDTWLIDHLGKEAYK